MASDLVVKIGGDTAEFQESLAGLAEHALHAVGEINPAIAGTIGLITAIGAEAIESGIKFEEAYNVIIAKTGATGDKLDSLKESFDAVFLAVPGDMEGIANALSLVSDRLHLTGEDLTNLTEQLAQLSAVSKEQIVPLTEAITKAFQNWNVATEDQKSKLDLLNTIAQTTGNSVTTLAGTMAEVGNLARLSGQSFEDTANQIGVLNSKGVDASAVFTGISRAIGQAQKAGSDLSDVTLVNLVYSIEQGIKSGNGLNVALDEFGTRAGPKMYQLVKDGIVSSAELMSAKLDTSTDSIQKAYAATDTFGRQLTILKDNLMVFLEPLGSFIVGVGKDFLHLLNDTITATRSVYDAMTGNTEGLKALWAEYDKANPRVATFGDTLADNKKIASDVNAGLGDLGITVNGVGQSTDKAVKPMVDVAAAMAAAKENTKLLDDGLKLYNDTLTAQTEITKALFIPSLLDVVTATTNVATARTAALTASDNLNAAETALGVLIDSGSKNNKALADAEAAVTSARTEAKSATDAYKDAEKDLTLSKSANAEITKTLAESEKVLNDAAKLDALPILISMADATAKVTAAQLDRSAKVDILKDAEQALSDFQNSTGKKDVTDEKNLIDAVTLARTNTVTAIGVEKQALTDLKVVKDVTKQLDTDIFNADKILAEYKKNTEIPTYKDLITTLQDVAKAKEAVQTAAENLKTATDAERAAAADDTTTQQDADTAKKNTKDAVDALKLAQIDLATEEGNATKQHGLDKAALDQLKPSVDGITNSADLATAAYHKLGINSKTDLDKMVSDADEAYKAIQASGTASATQLRDAQIAALKAQQDAYAQQGIDLPAADQITLAKLKQQHDDFNTDEKNKWGDLFTSIDGAVKGFASSAIHTLFTGQGSFHDEAISMLEGIGESIVTTFTKKATDAIASFIAGAITDLLSGKGLGGIMDDINNIGNGISKAFGGGGGAAGTAASAGGDAAGGAGGDAAGAAGSLASAGVTGIISAVTGVVSAVTGVISIFQNMHQETSLNAIELNTRKTGLYVGDRADGGILGEAFRLREEISFGTGVIVAQQSRDLIEQSRNAMRDVSDHTAYIQPTLDYFGPYIAIMPDKLDQLIAKQTVVNVKVQVGSKDVAAVIQTEMTNAMNLQVP